MSSSVFFRFKSQKEPTRVAFDGTGISVFELKREIIIINRLGDGSDFELIISSEESNLEYEDDTTIIPRSTTVIAKRLPATRPGRGGAARYVTGKMPQAARTSHRTEQPQPKPNSLVRGSGLQMAAAQTEEERTAAILQLGADQWAQQQQEMANATPVHRNANAKIKNLSVPNHPPPHGYICHRCEQPGHYIQNCPTNEDPTFDNRPRVKRTTGIPRSFLKTIEKPVIQDDDSHDESKRPMGVMMNSEGEWVVAEPDQAAFGRFQARAKVSAAAQEAASRGSKDLQEKGLQCPIDQRLFVEPTRTPCCRTVYCHECITNSLLESDLRCPSCSSENILIDDLKVDEDIVKKIRAYEEEQQAIPASDGDKTMDRAKPEVKDDVSSPHLAVIPAIARFREASPSTIASGSRGKKRPAENDVSTARTPPPPAMSKITLAESMTKESAQVDLQRDSMTSPSQQDPQGSTTPSNSTTFPGTNGMMPFPMLTAPNMSMIPGMLDPMMAQYIGNHNGIWNNMWNPTVQQQMMGGQFSNTFDPNMMYNGAFNHQNTQTPNQNGLGGIMGSGTVHHNQTFPGNGRGSLPYHQQSKHGSQHSNEEDGAYFRKPVNPHRHQARKNVNRPADYREV